MDTPTIIGYIVAIIVGGAVGYWLGMRKGRPVLGLVLGALFTLIGWIIMLIVPDKNSNTV